MGWRRVSPSPSPLLPCRGGQGSEGRARSFPLSGIVAVLPACLAPILLTALFLDFILRACSFHIMATVNKYIEEG